MVVKGKLKEECQEGKNREGEEAEDNGLLVACHFGECVWSLLCLHFACISTASSFAFVSAFAV